MRSTSCKMISFSCEVHHLRLLHGFFFESEPDVAILKY